MAELENTHATDASATPVSEFTRTDEFATLYANNVVLETSAWDLKLIFGQLDQSGHKARVEQHTAITIPWMQARVLSYMLQVYLAARVMDFGPIPVPSSVMPPSPQKATK